MKKRTKEIIVTIPTDDPTSFIGAEYKSNDIVIGKFTGIKHKNKITTDFIVTVKTNKLDNEEE